MNNFKGGNPELYIEEYNDELNFRDKFIDDYTIRDKFIDDYTVKDTNNSFQEKIGNIIRRPYKFINTFLLNDFDYYKYNPKNKCQLFNGILLNLTNFYIEEEERNKGTIQNEILDLIAEIENDNPTINILKEVLIETVKYGDINLINMKEEYKQFFRRDYIEIPRYFNKFFTEQYVNKVISDQYIEILFKLYIISKIFQI